LAGSLRVKRNDFACSCGEDGKQRCAKVRAWAMKRLEATPEDFLTKAVYDLSWRYNATITGIPNDQWSVITTDKSAKQKDGKYGVVWGTYIQCDWIEDGLAFTLRAYYDKYGTGDDWR